MGQANITKSRSSDECKDLKVQWAASSMQGFRETMEDADIQEVIMDVERPRPRRQTTRTGRTTTNLSSIPAKLGVFGVFDGHAGSDASKFVADELVDTLQKCLQSNETPAVALKQTHFKLERSWRQKNECRVHDNLGDLDSGTTAVIALITQSEYVFSTLGDSRLILVSDNKVCFETKDHKPSDDNEMKRVLAAGGQVINGRINGILGVSRSIGDLSFKQDPSRQDNEQMVSCEPSIERPVRRQPSDQFILLACDGVWDVMTSEEVSASTLDRMRRGFTLQQCADHLLDDCLLRNATDNLSCVIVALPGAPAELGRHPELGNESKLGELRGSDEQHITQAIKDANGLIVEMWLAYDIKLPENSGFLHSASRGDGVLVLGEAPDNANMVRAVHRSTGLEGLVPKMYLSLEAVEPLALALADPSNASDTKRLPPRRFDAQPCPRFMKTECRGKCKLDHDPEHCEQWQQNGICQNKSCGKRHLDSVRPTDPCDLVLDGEQCSGSCRKSHDLVVCDVFSRGGHCNHSCNKIHFKRQGVHKYCYGCNGIRDNCLCCSRGHAYCRTCIARYLSEDVRILKEYFSSASGSFYCVDRKCFGRLNSDMVSQSFTKQTNAHLRQRLEEYCPQTETGDVETGMERSCHQEGYPATTNPAESAAIAPAGDFQVLDCFGRFKPPAFFSRRNKVTHLRKETLGNHLSKATAVECTCCHATIDLPFSETDKQVPCNRILVRCGACKTQYCIMCMQSVDRDRAIHCQHHRRTADSDYLPLPHVMTNWSLHVRKRLQEKAKGIKPETLISCVRDLEKPLRAICLWPCSLGLSPGEWEGQMQRIDDRELYSMAISREITFQMWAAKKGLISSEDSTEMISTCKQMLQRMNFLYAQLPSVPGSSDVVRFDVDLNRSEQHSMDVVESNRLSDPTI